MIARVAARLLRVLVAAGLTAYLLWRSDPAAVFAAAAAADLRWIAAAIGLVLFDRALMAERWMTLLCIVDHRSRPPFRHLLEIFLVSTFVGTFLPASVGSDAVRAYAVSRSSVDAADAVASVFMDRMLGVASLLIMSLAGLFLARDLVSSQFVVASLAITAVACALTMAVVFSPGAGRRLAGIAPRQLASALSRVIGSVQRYAGHRLPLVRVLISSLAVQVLRVLQAYCLGRALGITAGMSVYVAFVPLILIVMLLPVTINGLGTSQALFIWFFARAGVEAPAAFALSILFVGLGMVGNLPGAALYLVKGVPRSAAVALALVFACAGAGCALEPPEKVPLRQLYTPRFPPPPPDEPALVSLAKAYDHYTAPQPPSKRSPFLPNQGGVLILALSVTLLVAVDYRNLRNPRNLDLLVMQAIGWFFYDILGFLDRLHDPTTRNLMDWVFTAIFFLTVWLLVRAVRRAIVPAPGAWTPALPRRALMTLAVGLVVLDVGMALYSPPDDAGYFVNIGGQRLRERLRLPYGDPLLTGTPAAAYGPVLYAAHVPFQLLLAPAPVNADSPDRPPIEAGGVYILPPLGATKLCTAGFQILAVWALFASARRLSGSAAAWALVALYAGSAYVLGVGGADYSIGGITFVSHIAPAAATLVAFALLDRPAWSGAALAVSVGVLFYPIFLVPAWLGYYWRARERRREFVVGFAIAATIIAGAVLVQSRPAGGRGLVGTIVYDTIGHQESPQAYGSSPFGFWGQRGGVRGWLMTPLVADQSMTRPIVLAFFAFAGGLFAVARGRTPAGLALLIAAVAMGAQLWKIHATATYVTWYYPFLLLGFLCDKPPLNPSPHA